MDVPDARVDHFGKFDAGARNLIANQCYRDRLGPTFTIEQNMDWRSLGAFEQVRDLGRGEARAIFVVDREDNVAGADTCFCGGRAFERRKHHRLLFARLDDHTDAIIFAFLIFAKESVSLWIEEIGVRIEHMQHAGNRTVVNHFVSIDGIRVIRFDGGEYGRESLCGALRFIGSRGIRPRWPYKPTENRSDGQNGAQEDDSTLRS